MHFLLCQQDKVNRRSIRPLVGCETVADVSAGGSQADELLQQQLATKQQQVCCLVCNVQALVMHCKGCAM
jgi:hypothetical protein